MLKLYQVDEARHSLLKRRAWDEMVVPESLLVRLEHLFGERISPEEATRRIVQDVRLRGDRALREWAQALDGSQPQAIRVPPEVIREAYHRVHPDVVAALQLAAQRIESFHRRQPAFSWIENTKEGTLGQLIRPIERVGIYAPGGSAPLPSSVLMSAIPARVAGTPFVAVVSPPQRDTGLPHPSILVAADLVKAEAVYCAGGAQAIAALAFGTESVQRVDKICGPGGLFTTLAKRQVYGMVGIDGLPGPTETLVIADAYADPRYVAADLLAQAEHDVLASAILLTPSRNLAEQVVAEINRQMQSLTRREILHESLTHNSGIVLTDTLEQAFDLANDYAPEHLCLLLADPWTWVSRVKNAGGVFLGERSFEVLGDYVAGPSHTMPTGGTARFASPLNVWDFVKIISLVDLNESGLQAIGPAAEVIAQAEGLTAHAAAVRIRLEEKVAPSVG
ncbi:MAG: histidinol dehydrogenase [Anaerolineales bacterium]|nr:histidinol dehydrogenase [Anaerolineales bacterium]MDW8226678.1 histidinol dehydrogenase [Anaerolineales bacterium]